MNRKYSVRDYLNLIRKIKKKLPLVSLTTDVLVGFPGESEADFQDTADLIEEVVPLKTHIFPYSRRDTTLAANNGCLEVAPLIIKERILRLEKTTSLCALKFQKQFLGQDLDVLIEERPDGAAGLWQGHTDNYLKIGVISNQNLKNKIINVSLKDIKKSFLLAEITD